MYKRQDQTYARRWGHYTYRNLPKIYDAHFITAEYLIDNIDRAFDNWQKRPWNRSLSFEDFCEYLLPYQMCIRDRGMDFRRGESVIMMCR